MRAYLTAILFHWTSVVKPKKNPIWYSHLVFDEISVIETLFI